MSKVRSGKAKPKTTLWYVGFWATIWWGVSGLYIVLVLWQARLYYANSPSNNFFSAWEVAIRKTLDNSSVLLPLFYFIIFVWLVGLVVWLEALKKQKISYKAAFKDLFLTIRK